MKAEGFHTFKKGRIDGIRILRYMLYQITWAILLIEFTIMFVCTIAIILVKTISRWNAQRNQRLQSELSTLIEGVLFNKRPLTDLKLPPKLCKFRNVIDVLEKYDHRFSDQRWTEVKNFIVDNDLLARAGEYVESGSWLKRQLAARCYLLCPEKATEKALKKLLNDSKYLVRVVAAVCITKCSYRELFCDVIRKMSKETTLSQFPYRDALIQVSQDKFQWIASLLQTDPDPLVSAICLDILSTRISHNYLPLIRPFVNGQNRECRILAIKALGEFLALSQLSYSTST